ncbi:MAG: LLM class flavin-dependent oxidoreductase [Steroidobacteraceae bacterium]
MNVGLYFDLRNPPEWAMNPSRVYGFTLEMCEEADRLGVDSLWFSEHHLFEDGYLTQPLTFAAAAAARTRAARLGTAVVIAPFHQPVRLAEEAAVVDLISGGRLDLGLGAGYRVPEFQLYDVDMSARYTSTDNMARELRRIWSEGRLTPAPAQQRIPIWLGYGGPKGARRAGVLGEGLLSIELELLEPYRQGLAESGHGPTHERMAGGVNGWVTDDPERDWPVVAKHLRYQLDSYRRYMVEGTDRPIPRPVDPDLIRQRGKTFLNPFFYGTAEHVAARIREQYGNTPVETLFLWASIAGMSEAMMAQHVQTVCTKLAPLLRT